MSDIQLTNRQYAVLRGLAAGLTRSQIARRMNRHLTTVERASRELFTMLGAVSSAQLIDRAWRLGILSADAPPLAAEQPMPAMRRYTDPPAVIRQRQYDLEQALRGREAT